MTRKQKIKKIAKGYYHCPFGFQTAVWSSGKTTYISSSYRRKYDEDDPIAILPPLNEWIIKHGGVDENTSKKEILDIIEDALIEDGIID